MRKYSNTRQLASFLIALALLVISCALPTSAQDRPVVRPENARAPRSELNMDSHNEIVKAALDNFPALARKLELRARKAQGKPRPTTDEIFAAMLQCPGVAPRTKVLIQQTQSQQRTLSRVTQKLSAADQRALAQIKQQVGTASSPQGVVQVLRNISASRSGGDADGISKGLRLAIDMVEKGSSTIYSPGYRAYTESPTSATVINDMTLVDIIQNGSNDVWDFILDVVGDDISGAIAGGITGFHQTGLAGVEGGAVIGAVVGSVKSVFDNAWDGVAA